MTAAIRVIDPRLFPPGTPLPEVPPDARTISWAEFEELRWQEIAAVARRDRRLCQANIDAMEQRRLYAARDGYGWRGLPGNSPTIAERP